jgi:hypothetical protein
MLQLLGRVGSEGIEARRESDYPACASRNSISAALNASG